MEVHVTNKRFWSVPFAIVGFAIMIYIGCGSSESASGPFFVIDGGVKAYTISDLLTLEQEGLISDGTLLSEYVPASAGSQIYAENPPTPDPTPPPQPTNPPDPGKKKVSCAGLYTTWGCIKAIYKD
jgi:hypothetical protein